MEQIMRVKIPTGPTIPNPQDTKDAPHSPNGGDCGFMPYAPAWERLPDAIRRVTAGRRPKELAQIDLCRAIADGTVKIRCKLKRHTRRHFTSKEVLQGKDFQIPMEIKPEDLDWEWSRPLKPWFVRRECNSIPGPWDLESIEVCSADVTKVLCVPRAQDENTQHAASETPASTSRPALESQEMPIGSGRRPPAGPRKPGAAGPRRRRGARPEKFENAKDAMRNDIHQGRYTVAQLRDMLEKNLATNYRVSRDTARKARNAVMSELISRQIPTNNK
jgi:pyruvate/2-oxoglutarate dehydrogenase complex dihydrolipoamide acyltransferase (E2) component